MTIYSFLNLLYKGVLHKMTTNNDDKINKKNVGQFIDSTEKFVKDTLKYFHLDHLQFDRFNFNFPNNQLPVSTAETEKDYTIDISLPGYRLGDIEIETYNNQLLVTAKKQSETKNIIAKTFKLPRNTITKDIKASFSNGVLTIYIPKNASPSY